MINRREFLAAGGAAALAAPSERPNIIIVFADDLGYGDLGCYGGEIPTPNLDRLASEGVRFTQGYVASPICSPSRVGLNTGQCPARHLIFSYLNTRAQHRQLGMRDYLDPNVPTIARTLQQAGYATAHFGKWHMGGGRDVDDAPHPQAYGFDESLVSFEGLGDRILPPGKLSDMSEQLGQGKITRVRKDEQTEIYVNRAIDFIRRNARRPFYLHVFPNDVHDPYQPKPELMKKYERYSANKYLQQFAATLDEMDRQLGRLFQAVDAAGIGGKTLIVFIGDNGPTAWPYYYKERLDPPGSTAGLRGRKWSLYEGGIREPFIVRWKGRAPAGRVDRQTVASSLDLFPTLCGLAGVKAPPVEFDGEDMSGAFLGKPQRRKKDLFWEYGRDATYLRPGKPDDVSPNLAMRSGDWKVLINDDGSSLELYDLGRSPVERTNLAAQEPVVAKKLADRLMAWRKSLPVLKTAAKESGK